MDRSRHLLKSYGPVKCFVPGQGEQTTGFPPSKSEHANLSMSEWAFVPVAICETGDERDLCWLFSAAAT